MLVIALEGSRAHREALLARANGAPAWSWPPTTGCASTPPRSPASNGAWVVVLDEAQYIKNHATKTTRAVKRLRSRLRFALTGTPVENRLSELWSIFDFLMPGFLGSYERFRERYELGIIGEDEEAAARLRALIEPFVLRRRKADVLTDLPAKFEGYPLCAPFREQRRLYDGAEQRLRGI